MSKYYVDLGGENQRYVLTATDPREAIKVAILRDADENDEIETYNVISVSERGFETHEDDLLFLAEPILNELGFECEPQCEDFESKKISFMDKLKELDEYYRNLGEDDG